MDNQTQRAFALGGEAETRDPVSGNDVPPGSLPVEVRDDLPARLSEGEYVVPADVVRFFGVKFFEDLRTQAKMGLQQMDADGRIGGDPVPSMGEDTLSDEQFNEILMAELGTNGSETEKAFAHGGLHTENKSKYTSNLNTLGFGGNYNFGSTPTKSSATTEEVTLYSPEGVAQVVQRPSSLYDTLIMAGYTVANPSDLSTPTEPIVTQNTDGDSDPVKEADPNAWMEGFKYDSAKSLYESSIDSLNPPTGVGGAINRVIGGLSPFLGALGAASKAAMVGGNLAILKEQIGTPKGSNEFGGETETFLQEDYDLLETKLQAYITANGLENMPEEYYNGDQYAKQINATQTDFALSRNSTDWRGDPIFKSDEEWNDQMQKTAQTGYEWNSTIGDRGAYVPIKGYDPFEDRTVIGTTSGGMEIKNDDSGGDDPIFVAGHNVYEGSPLEGTTITGTGIRPNNVSVVNGKTGKTNSSGSSGGDIDYSTDFTSSNDDYFDFNKGGLISKPKKKKAKAYKRGGLASKKK